MNTKRYWIGLSLLVSALSAGGCATRSAEVAADQIRALEREVARLKSERANLDARAGVMDDKVVLLETRLKKCTQASERSLRVVKLTPADMETEDIKNTPDDETGTDESWEISEPPKSRGQKRPSLVLTRSGGPRSIPAASARSAGPLSVPNGFDELGADNLGVVSKDSSSEAPAGEMEMFNEGYRAFSNKQHDKALAEFAGFVKAHPDHPYADDAMYWRGECYLAQGKFLHAVGEFERLVRRYPSSEKVSSGLYRIGFAYDKLRDFGKAYEYYFEVVEKFPGTDAARRAGSRVAEIKNAEPSGGPLLPTSAAR